MFHTRPSSLKACATDLPGRGMSGCFIPRHNFFLAGGRTGPLFGPPAFAFFLALFIKSSPLEYPFDRESARSADAALAANIFASTSRHARAISIRSGSVNDALPPNLTLSSSHSLEQSPSFLFIVEQRRVAHVLVLLVHVRSWVAQKIERGVHRVFLEGRPAEQRAALHLVVDVGLVDQSLTTLNHPHRPAYYTKARPSACSRLFSSSSAISFL